MRQLISAVIAMPIRFYRYWVSPWLAPRCRFYPTCSAYALDALKEHGPLRGSGLTMLRVAKCHPFHPGGFDPVPQAFSKPKNCE